MKKISVIMPSFLGNYDGCAEDRDNKFIRAVNSFLCNDYKNSELVIIGDCCSKTESLLKEIYAEELVCQRIKFYNFTKKQKTFSGILRSMGLDIANGEVICYLDTDDMIAENHLSSIMEQMDSEKLDWCYYNDFIKTDKALIPKEVSLVHGSVGTSSIAHINEPSVRWDNCNGYGHDFLFIKKLINWSSNHSKIYGCTYMICHVPNHIDK